MKPYYVFLIALIIFSCKSPDKNKTSEQELVQTTDNPLIFPEEVHFKDLRQVTFGGDNAEA